MFIASTLTNPQNYTLYGGHTGTDVIHSVLIQGGHGLTNRHLVTLEGVITQVSDEDYALLQKNELFQYHVKKGFLKVTDQSDPLKAVSDMEARDECAPMTQNDVDVLIDENINDKSPNVNIELTFDNGQPEKKRSRN